MSEFSPECLLGLPWEEAQRLAEAHGVKLLAPLITAPPRPKVLLGKYRVIGWRPQQTSWQPILAAEQSA